eukprot:COSAG04_NODE_6236_length_1376_cov_4.687549_1_plen_255_part_00
MCGLTRLQVKDGLTARIEEMAEGGTPGQQPADDLWNNDWCPRTQCTSEFCQPRKLCTASWCVDPPESATGRAPVQSVQRPTWRRMCTALIARGTRERELAATSRLGWGGVSETFDMQPTAAHQIAKPEERPLGSGPNEQLTDQPRSMINTALPGVKGSWPKGVVGPLGTGANDGSPVTETLWPGVTVSIALMPASRSSINFAGWGSLWTSSLLCGMGWPLSAPLWRSTSTRPIRYTNKAATENTSWVLQLYEYR